METVKWGIIGCGDVCEVKSGPGILQSGPLRTRHRHAPGR